MAIGDVYQIIDKQKYGAQDVLNVYYYRALANGITAADVDILFRATVVSQVILIQTSVISHNSVQYINLNDPADFLEQIIDPGLNGVVPPPNAPSFNAWAFKLIRQDRTVRNGRKSIAGVAEDQTADNNPTVAARPELDDTAAAFATVLDNGLGIVLEPVIYGRPTGAPNNLPLRVVTISGAEFSHYSTQNSRKNF